MRVPTGRLWVVEDPEPPVTARADETPSPGRYIREQRLRRGMTLEEVAERTKIPRASVEALEDERFEALPGPVFVKGFLRCCARALEIDEQVVLDLLYEQERARLRADREAAAPARASGRAAARGASIPAAAPAESISAAAADPGSSGASPLPAAIDHGGSAGPVAAAPPAPGSLRPSPRAFSAGASGVGPAPRGGLRGSRGADESGADRSRVDLPATPPSMSARSARLPIADPVILGRARDLLERAGAVVSRVPGANFLLWIAVAVLVVGVAFAVFMAISAQRMLPPHS